MMFNFSYVISKIKEEFNWNSICITRVVHSGFIHNFRITIRLHVFAVHHVIYHILKISLNFFLIKMEFFIARTTFFLFISEKKIMNMSFHSNRDIIKKNYNLNNRKWKRKKISQVEYKNAFIRKNFQAVVLIWTRMSCNELLRWRYYRWIHCRRWWMLNIRAFHRITRKRWISCCHSFQN